MNKVAKLVEDEKRQKLQIWQCDGCSAVHFKAGSVLLNFTRGEFSELTHAMMEIYQEEFGNLEFYDLLNSVKNRDEILISRSVS
jgi:hypothetical protein